MALAGKIVFVTGASSGIGEALVRRLVAAGASVAAFARRGERLTALENDLGPAAAAHYLPLTGSVTSRSDLQHAIARTVAHFGGLNILINNAGVMLLSFVDKVKVEEWDRMVDTNIKGVMYATAEALESLTSAPGGGYIVNISSDADRKVFPGSAVYSGTKAFVSLWSEGLRAELASKGVRVTSISCGAVSTELASHISDQDVLDGFASFPKITFLAPEDIASAVVWCLTQPAHVDVNNVFVRPTMQTQ